MAYRVSNTTGNASSTTLWDTVTNVPTLHASTNVTINNAGTPSFTAGYTAPNTVNTATGVLLYINARGTAGTLTVTLQESTVDTAATASIAVTSLVAGTWLYLRYGSAYTFTTTTASAYRVKVVITGGTGTTSIAADSGGTTLAFFASDNRTGAVAATDDLIVAGSAYAALTVTLDANLTAGSGILTTSFVTVRVLGLALLVTSGAVLAWTTSASATLTLRGSIGVDIAGELQIGSVATPVPIAYTARLTFDNPSASNQCRIVTFAGAVIAQGAARSYWHTTYASGIGTAANPLILAEPVDWNVGDEIIVCAASNTATNYNENERRFIITKNSTTSYVVSSTSGGPETALAFTHTTAARVVLLTRNVIIDTTNTARSWELVFNSTTSGLINLDWVRLETVGLLTFESNSASIANADYCVFYRLLVGGGGTGYTTASRVASTHTGLVFFDTVTSNALRVCTFSAGSANQTFVDPYFINMNRSAVLINTASDIVLRNARFIGINISNSTGNDLYAIGLTYAIRAIIDNCDFVAIRQSAVKLNNAIDSVFNNALFGINGLIVTALDVVSTSYNSVLLNSARFNATNAIINASLMSTGSRIAFQNYDATVNRHQWYTPGGEGQSTGAGLPDTTVKTPGSLGVRLQPYNNTSGMVWEFNILAKANSIVTFVGFFQRNVALGTDTARVELFLPGSTVADASYVLPTTASTWLPVVIAANYVGTVDLLATVRVTVLSAAASAYLYADDFYNAGTANKIAGLDTWQDGLPVKFIVDTTFDPASIWSYPLNVLNVSNTTGNALRETLSVGKFIALK
jgi:hypothetical protein